MTTPAKFARDLAAGDRIVVAHGNANGHQATVTVLAVAPSVQTYKRKVLIVTLRTEDGVDLHRTFTEHHTVRLVT